MKKIALSLALLLLGSVASLAQLAPNAVNGCQYNSATPILSNGQTIAFQCDVNGKLKVTGATTPSGPAGGVLSGTYPNPAIAASANLGTPGTLVGTNITGTAAGLTAGNVTTNANLTGPITSVGNATSIASQTGTGSTFVVQTSPSLTTPNIGVATATTINKVTITAPATGSTLTIPDGVTLNAGAGGTLGSNAFTSTAYLPLAGGTLVGTLVTAATDATTSAGGALQVAGGASIAKRFWIPAITPSSGLQTAVLCQSSGGEMIADSIACLASSARFKTILGPVEDGALEKLNRLPIDRWHYNAEGIFHDERERIGPIAEDVAAIDPRLVGYDTEGRVRTVSTEQLLALTIKAVQELARSR